MGNIISRKKIRFPKRYAERECSLVRMWVMGGPYKTRIARLNFYQNEIKSVILKTHFLLSLVYPLSILSFLNGTRTHFHRIYKASDDYPIRRRYGNDLRIFYIFVYRALFFFFCRKWNKVMIWSAILVWGVGRTSLKIECVLSVYNHRTNAITVNTFSC